MTFSLFFINFALFFLFDHFMKGVRLWDIKNCFGKSLAECVLSIEGMNKHYFIIIIISLFLSACTGETGRKLEYADSVMEEHPDSAMSILMGIDRYSLKKSDLPYYALLYTQAQVKTDIPLDSDSLISIAYAKYGSDSRGDRGIRSNFYTGEVFLNQEKYREAMRYYLTAYEESKRLSNDYWHAKAAERISNIFFFIYNYDEAAKYVYEAADLYKKTYKLSNNRYALGQLANIWLNNGKSDKAYLLIDSLRTLSLNEHPIDSAFMEYIKIPWIYAMLENGKVEELLTNELDFKKGDLTDKEIIDRAILQSLISNIIDESNEERYRLNDIMSFAHSDEDKIHILFAQYENAKDIGETSLALSLVDSMLYYQNKVAMDIIKESVTATQRDFYSQMSVSHENRTKLFKYTLVIAIIIFLILISGGVIFVILKNKVQKAELEANLEAFLSLKHYSDQISREKDVLEQTVNEKKIKIDLAINQLQEIVIEKQQEELSHAMVVETLFKEKWQTLDILCDQYFGFSNYELTPKGLVSNIERELKKIISEKGIDDIVDATDTYMGNIVSKLRNQFPSLKNDDINFLALLFAGFSVRAVCMFTGIKYQHFYVKKSRLIKRIQASEAPDKTLFLEKLK